MTKAKLFRNSVFIAYHGTYDKGGTALEADRIRIKLRDYPIAEAYSGPNTDERTFDKHANEVIPNSALFLLVVNDFCPHDESGCLNKEISKYLYGEISAFYKLYKSGERNKKDFAVYYCGNVLADKKQQAAYISRLLLDIDPDGELCTGNQFFVVDNIGLDGWINSRLVKPEISVLTDETYYPFSLLREKVKDVLERKSKDIFVLQMERGMGKSTFVRALERDEEFAKTAAVKAIYVSRDKNYASPENFLWDFSDLLRKDGEGNMRSVDVMPVDIINSDPVQSFVRFVNEFKNKYYADKKLFIVIDGIDDMGTGGRMTITDFFETAEFCEGVYVMFTCRIFGETDGLRNASYGFVKRFTGEKIVFDSQNYDYLKFLYDYFNDNVISQFPKGNAEANVRDIFSSISPKNILSFSILIKIGNIYFSNTKPEKVDWRILSSLENALDFYYNYMKTELNREAFDCYKKLLALFALSDYSLTTEDLKEGFGLDFSEKLLNKNGFLRIFIRVHDETAPVSFGIIHDRVKQLILSDEESDAKNLVNEIFTKLSVLAEAKITLGEKCVKRFALFKFLGTLLSGELISPADKEVLAERILNQPYALTWAKPVSQAEPERMILKSLTEYINSSRSALGEKFPAETAHAYAVYAHDCFLLNYFCEAGWHFESCKKYYDKLNISSAPPEVRYKYATMLTMYGTHLRLCNRHEEAIKLFKECTDICDELYRIGGISLADYAHYYVAKSNIYQSLGDSKNQKKSLDTAMKIGGKKLREVFPARYAFMNVALSSYYEGKKKYKKAFSLILLALKCYKEHYDRDWHTMFVGDFVACVAYYIDRLYKFRKADECAALVREAVDYVNAIIKETNFSNPNIDMLIPETTARCYLKLGMKNECVAECNKLLNKIEVLCAGKNRDFDSVRAFKKRTEEILGQAQNLTERV